VEASQSFHGGLFVSLCSRSFYAKER